MEGTAEYLKPYHPTPTGVPRSQEAASLWEPAAGTFGSPKGGAVFHERGTPLNRAGGGDGAQDGARERCTLNLT